jgi:hypothetical protein
MVFVGAAQVRLAALCIVDLRLDGNAGDGGRPLLDWFLR